MDNIVLAIITAIITSSSLTAVITFVLSRRKLIKELEEKEAMIRKYDAETLSETTEATKGLFDLQQRYQDLSEKFIIVSATNAANEARLADREKQVGSLSEQVETFRALATNQMVTDALRRQLDSMTGVVEKLKDIISERERTFNLYVERTTPLPAPKIVAPIK